MKKQDKNNHYRKFLLNMISTVSALFYLGWRLLRTIPDPSVYGWVALVGSIVVLASEAVSMLEGTGLMLRMRSNHTHELPVVPPEEYPDVDIFIATHNEACEILYKTINGCRFLEYPDKNKVHVYVCDDGDRQEMKELAESMGVGYFGLSGNKLAKAGNLNHGLGLTDSPWVITLDADMIPTSRFLMETVPYVFLPKYIKEDGVWRKRREEEIDPSYEIGFIQTPQSFYNPDVFQYFFYAEDSVPNEQDFFFREINTNRNGANSPIYAGSNTLISRKALNEVGGIATGTITEDFETGIKIQSRGYSCFATERPLVHGLAPSDIPNLIQQRIRWGRGCISSLRRIHLLTNKSIPWSAKLSYLDCYMYWGTFLRRFFFMISPMLFVLFGIPVVQCSLREILLIWLPCNLIYTIAMRLSSSGLQNNQWSGIVDTIMFPHMVIPLLMETFMISQKKFLVTNKNRSSGVESNLVWAIPHIFLLFFDMVAFLICAKQILVYQFMGAIIMEYWLFTNGMLLLMAVVFMTSRRKDDMEDSVVNHLPIELLSSEGAVLEMTTVTLADDRLVAEMDLQSEGDEQAAYLPDFLLGKELILLIADGPYDAKLHVQVTAEKKKEHSMRYSFRLMENEEPQIAQYMQIMYDRPPHLADRLRDEGDMWQVLYHNMQLRVKPQKH